MFRHGKTDKNYYSVREKINYYNKMLNGKIEASAKDLRRAKLRLKTLNKINNQSYDEPRLIVTDDKHFGNPISKPRLCVAFGEDSKQRIKVFPIQKRTTKLLVIDNNYDRQIESKFRMLDKSNVYETKYINNIKPLTTNMRKIIKEVHK